jgi:hypothetical protein
MRIEEIQSGPSEKNLSGIFRNKTDPPNRGKAKAINGGSHA